MMKGSILIALSLLSFFRLFAVVIFDLPTAFGCLEITNPSDSTVAPCIWGATVRNNLGIDLKEYLDTDPIFGGNGMYEVRVIILMRIVSFIASPLLWVVVVGLWLRATWSYILGLAEATLLLSILVPIFYEYYLRAPNHYIQLWLFNCLDMLTPFLLLAICIPALLPPAPKRKVQ